MAVKGNQTFSSFFKFSFPLLYIVPIAIVCGLFNVAFAQLPPEVLADKYLMQVEQLVEKNDHGVALSLMDSIKVMEKEHNITLREDFHFKYAKIAYAAGRVHTAMDAVSEYLAAGRRGEYYDEALALLIRAEQVLADFDLTAAKKCTSDIHLRGPFLYTTLVMGGLGRVFLKLPIVGGH